MVNKHNVSQHLSLSGLTQGVHWGSNPPPLKNTVPSFFAKTPLPLNQHTAQAPFLGNSPYQAFIHAVLLMSIVEQRFSFWML